MKPSPSTIEKFIDIAKKVKDTAFISGPVLMFLGYVTFLVIKDTDVYKEFENVVSFGYEAKNVIIPKSDSLNRYQNNEIEDLWFEVDDIQAKINTETIRETSFQIGLRYDEATQKMYFKTIDKELREVKKDYEKNLYYYRDAQDEKRYVNY